MSRNLIGGRENVINIIYLKKDLKVRGENDIIIMYIFVYCHFPQKGERVI
jgi:hypothetical protein